MARQRKRHRTLERIWQKRGKNTWCSLAILPLDAWIARVMKEKIEKIGASCWLDEKDLEGGNIIGDDIINGINACDEAVVLISPNSVKSQWVPFEIGAVRAQYKRVTPILNNVKPEKMAPSKDIKGIELNGFDQFLAQLKKRIGKRK